MISIEGLNKAEVLAALYNASRPVGMGALRFMDADLSILDATRIIERGQLDFDYLQGRVMKVDLSSDEFDERLYDRDNGYGAAFDAVSALGTLGK